MSGVISWVSAEFQSNLRKVVSPGQLMFLTAVSTDYLFTGEKQPAPWFAVALDIKGFCKLYGIALLLLVIVLKQQNSLSCVLTAGLTFCGERCFC